MKTDNVEDIYELSPMQQGMLFHTLYAPESGLYFEQSCFPCGGSVNLAAFESAWQKVIDRHGVLRASFHWEGLEKPLQVVHRHVQALLDYQDWREITGANQQERLSAYLRADRARGFGLSQAPLVRIGLIRLGEEDYRCVFSFHHLLLDGWSQHLVMREFSAFYDAFCQNRELRLLPPKPYGDYIAWVQKQDLEAAEAFWRRVLKGFTAPTPIPVKQPAGDGAGEPQSADEWLALSGELSTRLYAMGRQHQLTTNTIVQGAWAVLLSRYSGERDVVFGSVVSGRPASLSGVESMVGLFINTLPVRVGVLPDRPVLSFLREIQDYLVETRQYEYTPLVEIQGWSEAPNGVPLFDSIVVFQNYPVGNPRAQIELSQTEGYFEYFEKTNYPLTVMVLPAGELTLKILFHPGQFASAAIKRMLVHLAALLESICLSPEGRLSDLRLLAEPERRQLLIEWNSTEAEYPREACVHQLVEIQAGRTPDATAAEVGSERLTYGELNRRANGVALYLQSLGVGPESLVGISMERSLDLLVGILGVLKAGAGYVPIDPAYPKQRISFMIEDAAVAALFSGSRLVAQQYESNPTSAVNSENLAYVIYTSGSTGRPKGVAMPHHALSNLLTWQVARSTAPAQARTLQFASLSFDVSFQEIFSTWCSGGTVVMISEEVRRDPVSLLVFVEENAIERLFLPFVALDQLAEASGRLGLAPSRLREIITAGEQLRITPAISRLFQKLESCSLDNQYGPTESHVVTAFRLTGPTGQWPALPPIGRPIANAKIYLLDRDLNPAPVGVLGELYIGGDVLARGYLRRPDLTDERFIPDPFSAVPGARLYKTGDLARYLDDGNIEFVGRLDHQIKIRGFRVEPGEVEAALRRHPTVREAAVAALDSPSGDRRLVAYIVPRDNVPPDSRQLRSLLQETLPAYMVPSTFVLMDALPLNPNGKVDRHALPSPEAARPELQEGYVAPRNAVEQVMARIWAEVLDLERVGVNDDFFHLGGHSLLVTRLISRVREALQIDLPLRAVFESRTIAELASAILATTSERVRIEKTAELLLAVEQLPEQEAAQKLSERVMTGGNGGSS